MTQNGEYESVDAVLFGSSSLVFEFHLIYMNLCQKWTIYNTTTVDLRGSSNYNFLFQNQSDVVCQLMSYGQDCFVL